MADAVASSQDGLVDEFDQRIVLAAARHDVPLLSRLCPSHGPGASMWEDGSGYSALHAAIAGAEDKTTGLADQSKARGAEDSVRLLLANGASWNDVDAKNDTPGCIAYRLGLKGCYEQIVDAGVRAELLFAKMDEYDLLADDEEEAEALEIEALEEEVENADAEVEVLDVRQNADINNADYLTKPLDLSRPDRVLDAQQNGVMMAWEDGIMKRSAEVLCLPSETNSGEKSLSVLNIGHGMGIMDTYLQSHKPTSHHIIEAHADVLAQMRKPGGWLERHNTSTSKAESEDAAITLHEGTWQMVLPELVLQDITFDAIYFDTFAESYAAFKDFFNEHVVALLKPGGRWSFFHGLGADRKVCYDVYTKVAEIDLYEAGFDVTWETLKTPKEDVDEQWKGVRRRYWDLDEVPTTAVYILGMTSPHLNFLSKLTC